MALWSQPQFCSLEAVGSNPAAIVILKMFWKRKKKRGHSYCFCSRLGQIYARWSFESVHSFSSRLSYAPAYYRMIAGVIFRRRSLTRSFGTLRERLALVYLRNWREPSNALAQVVFHIISSSAADARLALQFPLIVREIKWLCCPMPYWRWN